MAATPSLVIKKTFPYRGGTQEWSNRYHFLGGTPADNTHWDTFMDAVVTAEKAVLFSDVEIVEAVGYNAGSTISAHSRTYTTAGTFSPASGRTQCPGDCAAVIRYATAARSSKGHPIYLFNYYHRAFTDDAVDTDTLLAGYATALGNYGTAWWSTGFSDGTNTYTRAGPQGAAATARHVLTYVTHRDFPN